MVVAMAIALVSFTAKAQNTYKLALSSGKLIVSEVGRVKFEGHDGNDILIENKASRGDRSERAEGLRVINGLGLDDNTGIGLHQEKTGNEVTLKQVSNKSSADYVIKVPKGVSISYEHSSVFGNTVEFENLENEVEVSTNHSGVKFRDLTGPVSISTVHGEIEGSFSSLSQKNPSTIVSSHGLIDVSLPASSKANLQLSSNWGEIFSDMDIAIDKSKGEMKSYASNKVEGTINGGGVIMKIECTHGNIYLRKK